MTGIKVHGNTLSTAAARVLATLYEKDLEFELVPIDMRAGEHKTEAFLALNPFGQVQLSKTEIFSSSSQEQLHNT
ncbi:hypothetical protein M0R45_011133 [Rubus argutus]|uniref:glutathione transferase n=1 Tax=Rubus argutus TaxID=59490 RepID=A0AAW1YD37_RUBAR